MPVAPGRPCPRALGRGVNGVVRVAPRSPLLNGKNDQKSGKWNDTGNAAILFGSHYWTPSSKREPASKLLLDGPWESGRADTQKHKKRGAKANVKLTDDPEPA